MPTIHALLVGINAYPISPLRGCINDVNAVEAYLRASYDNAPGLQLRIQRITDEEKIQPTRQNIIDGFGFFKEAKEGDVCLFYYSGHGSFTAAPKEFWTEIDGNLESFVCIDSRLPGGQDLTNKEMGYLIAKTLEGKKDVQFVAITDCCHSGTITKALTENQYIERSMVANFIPANIEDYLGYRDTINGQPAYQDKTENGKRKVTVQQAPHIHLAASRDNQTAKERIIEGRQHGAFTYSLLKTLYSNKGLISYQKLMASTVIQVANLVQAQDPVFNLNGGLSDAAQKLRFLLNSTDTTVPTYKVYWDNQSGWCIAAGAIHGASVGDTVIIEGVGETKIIKQQAPDFSMLESITQFGGKEDQYEAKLMLGATRKVKLAFADEIAQPLKNLIQAAYQKLQPTYAELTADAAAQYYIRNNQHGVFMTLPASEIPIFDYCTINSAAEAGQFIEKTAAVANWLQLLEVNNPYSRLTEKDYQITITQSTEAGNSDPASFIQVEDITKPLELYYQYNGTEWQQPAIQVTLTNISSRELWFSALYMDVDYSIYGSDLVEARLPAGNTTTLNMLRDHVPIDFLLFEIQDELYEKGYYDITEYLKIFISTEPIDTSKFNQQGLELAPNARGLLTEKSLSTNSRMTIDWKTETIRLHIVRPQESTQLNTGSTYFNDITIDAPASFSAQVAITSSQKNGITTKSLTPDRLQQLGALEPFPLVPQTRIAPALDVLELTNVINTEAVSRETPLTIQLPTARGLEVTSIIPLGLDPDTGLYYPLGFVDEANKVHIQQLPAPTPDSGAITAKSVWGSVKIYFRKVVSDWFGLPNPYPKLGSPNFLTGQLKYEYDKTELKKKVAKANTILLMVHGIIGDTKSIATSFKTVLDSQQQNFQNVADLVLTFDYENLKTSITETARLLQKELADIGLEEGHGKTLVIMAHSMGGLVSRWFIEKEGGEKVVSTLVMFGTPNMGTPWADVRDMAQAIITYAVNGASFLQPWLFVLSAVGKLANGTQVTLKEMDAQTGIYDELNDGKANPSTKYIVVSGNTQTIVPDYDKTSSLLGRLFKKAKYTGYHVLDSTLFKKPNDIAVSVASIEGIPGSEKWQMQPVRYAVPCDHLNYFTIKEAIKHLQG
jgi:hypothetical protein